MMLIIFQIYFMILNIGHLYHHHEHCITCSLICQWKNKIDYQSLVIISFVFALWSITRKIVIQKNALEHYRTLITLKVELNN